MADLLTQLSHRYASDSRNAAENWGFRRRRRFVVLKMLPFAKTFDIDRLDTEVVA